MNSQVWRLAFARMLLAVPHSKDSADRIALPAAIPGRSRKGVKPVSKPHRASTQNGNFTVSNSRRATQRRSAHTISSPKMRAARRMRSV